MIEHEAVATLAELEKQYPAKPLVERRLGAEARAGSPSAEAQSDEELKLLASNGLIHPDRAIPMLEKILPVGKSDRRSRRNWYESYRILLDGITQQVIHFNQLGVEEGQAVGQDLAVAVILAGFQLAIHPFALQLKSVALTLQVLLFHGSHNLSCRAALFKSVHLRLVDGFTFPTSCHPSILLPPA